MRRITRLVGAILSFLLLLLLVGAGGLVFLLGTEPGERFVQAQTTAALSRLLGPRYEATLGRQQLEFRGDGTLALNWYDAALHRTDDPTSESRVERVSVALRLMPLVGGSLEFGRLEIAGADLNLAAFAGSRPRPATPGGEATQPAGGSVLAQTIDGGVAALERQLQALQAFHFDTLSLQDIRVVGLPGAAGRLSDLTLRRAELHRALDGTLRLVTNVEAGGMPLLLSGTAAFDEEANRLTRLAVSSGRIALGAVLPPADAADEKDERPFGSDSEVWLNLSLDRDDLEDLPTLRASAHVGAGDIQLGLNRTRIESGRLDLTYRQGDERLVIEASPFRFRDVAFDLSGSVEQTNRAAPDEAPVFGFRLAAPDVRSKVGQEGEADPLVASLDLAGEIAPAARRLSLASARVATGGGTLEGSAGWDGSAPDARTFLELRATSLPAASVKAFWPFNISGKARKWVLAHLANEGEVATGTIAIDLVRDRIHDAFRVGGTPGDTELRLDIPVRGVALSTVGDLPHLQGADGTITVRGIRTEVALDRASVEGLEGVAIEPSTLVLQRPADGNPRDLGLMLDLEASGEVAQLLRIADREPIRAFRNLPLQIDPFKGRASARVGAMLRLGDGIPRDRQVETWSVEADLDGVDPGQPIEGRQLSGLDGVFRAIPGQASGSFDGTVDGMPAKLSFALPFGETPVGTRSIEADLKVPSAKVVALVPALDGVINGPVAARVTDDADGLRASVDLGQTTLDLPAVAWKKGAGIPADLTFAMRRDGDTTELRDLDLKGDGFRASGTIAVDKRGLRKAALSRVALNPGDSVAVDVERHGDGFGIQVSGERFDARPILAEIKAGLGQDKKGRVGGGTFDVTLDVGRLDGFNGRGIDGFSLNYASSDGRMAALALGGSIGGASVVGDLAPRDQGRRIRIASDDVGGLLGFAGLYGHMEGGQGTLALIGSPDAGYAGELMLTNFNLVDEPRLSRIVGSSPAPGTASLSEAIGQELRTERAFFDHASARLAYDKGMLRVADGIVRGPIFGSSFAGVVYDPSGQIDVSGSFMPAYGINRVFGAIPILGQILGNGQEGGLIGITYRLSGAMASPTLVVNPISAIAPGIFRQIFAFD